MGGKFVKGQSGNPGGRPKGAKSEIDKLRAAIKLVEKEEGIPLYRHFIKRAYLDDTVLIALGKKVLPDLKSIEAQVTGDMNFGVIVLPSKLPAGAPCEVEKETDAPALPSTDAPDGARS